MNAHDSEKVIGTLEQQGYARVEDESDAGLILYNTCSIRDKAEQKVFHRLNEYKRRVRARSLPFWGVWRSRRGSGSSRRLLMCRW
jgi:tRNA A37 methylthiotransferase MiaB